MKNLILFGISEQVLDSNLNLPNQQELNEVLNLDQKNQSSTEFNELVEVNNYEEGICQGTSNTENNSQELGNYILYFCLFSFHTRDKIS